MGMFLLRMKKTGIYLYAKKGKKKERTDRATTRKSKDLRSQLENSLLNPTRFKRCTTAPEDQAPTVMGLLSGVGFIFPLKFCGLVFLVLRAHK